MGDPYRRLFLDNLELVLKKEPNRETMLELLQLATPGLNESSLQNSADATKLFRTLLSRVHPDKHLQDAQRATRLCQDAQTFFDKCRASSPEPKRKKHKKSSSPTSTVFPFEFNCSRKWPHIEYCYPGFKARGSDAELYSFVAYQCINARGAIAHGRKISKCYNPKGSISTANYWKDVESVFSRFGGVKELEGVDDIKKEIMTNGPVVSTSFCPGDAFLKNNPILRNQSDYLIVGWKLNEYGEVWLVQPLYQSGTYNTKNNLVNVAVGQFGIDDGCLAPSDSFDDFQWQKGPYLNLQMTQTDPAWRTTWKSFNTSINSLAELEPLFREMGTVSFSASAQRRTNQSWRITIRDKNKRAHSRRGTLRSIKWDEENKDWRIKVAFD